MAKPSKGGFDAIKSTTRKSWKTITEGRRPDVVEGLSSDKMNMYQSKYDILTSENDYITTLRRTEKLLAKEKIKILTSAEEFTLIFGELKVLRQISEDVLFDLREDWNRDVFMDKMPDIMQKHSKKIYYYYLEYVKHYKDILGGLRRVVYENQRVRDGLERISSQLFMSFENVLHMPLMRVRELCRLLQNVLERLEANDFRSEYEKTLAVSRFYEKLAVDCDNYIVDNESRITSSSDSGNSEVDKASTIKDRSVGVDVSTRINRYSSKNNSKLLWVEMPEVIKKKTADRLSTAQRLLQEAMFEIVTSQATFIKSLVTFEAHYIKNIELSNILLEDDFRTLFSTIKEVRRSSELFFVDLDEHFQKDVTLEGLFAILNNHLNQMHTFKELNKYAKQYPKQKQCFDSLMQGDKFKEFTEIMAKHPLAEGLKINSYFMVPVQRVTKLDLLMKTILKHMPESKKEQYKQVQALSEAFEQLAGTCNESVAYAENKEKTREVCNLMVFSKNLQPIMLMETNRYFKKRTVVREVDLRTNTLHLAALELFLFNDVLVITQKESTVLHKNTKFKIKDYAWIKTTSASPLSMLSLIGKVDLRQLAPIMIKFSSARHKKTTEMVVSFAVETDREPWLKDLNDANSQGPFTLFRGNSFIL